MNYLTLLLSVLAVHRLSALLADDKIAEDIRDLPDYRSMLWYGVRCFRCTSVWMAGIITMFLYFEKIVEGKWVGVVILALSSGAICLERLTTKGN